MNVIAKYISELLYRYECVILPGFGAFLTKRQPAIIQESTHVFFPPQKLISFNSQLQDNDGLLANYIAVSENISYADAVTKIQHYVLLLHDKISQGERVAFDIIGSFFTSVEDTLQFQPSQETNCLTEAFGLSSFISPAVVREEEVAREVYKKQVVKLEKTIPVDFTPERRRERSYMKYAAIAVIAMGVGGFLGLNHLNRLEEKGAQILLENRMQQATFTILSPLPAINLTTVKEAEIVTGNYHIVAGAYRIKSNANKKVEKLTQKGFKAHIISANKYGLHQVIYSSYQNKKAALKALKNIKKQQDHRAWLLIKEL